MSNVFHILSEETFSDKFSKLINVLDVISKSEALTNNKIFKIDSWTTVQSIIRRGLVYDYFRVGDQLQSYHKIYGTGADKLLTWDIVAINHDVPVATKVENGEVLIDYDTNGKPKYPVDSAGQSLTHSMTLQLHSCISARKWHHSYANVWKNSDIRKWLNTDGIVADYSQDAGFLYNFDPDLLDVIGYVAKTTARNKSSGGKAILLPERIFLPSVTEVFAGFTEGYAEGALILTTDTEKKADKFYCTLDSTTGIITKVDTPVGQTNPVYEVKQWYKYYGAPDSDLPSPSFAADTHRIKQLSGSNQDWMTRSPYPDDIGYIYGVGIGGIIDRISYTNNTGVAPACVIF